MGATERAYTFYWFGVRHFCLCGVTASRLLKGVEKMTNEEIVQELKQGHDTKNNMFVLWVQNERLIGAIAKKYCGYESIEDLKQQGYFGLCRAVENYDSTAGVLFSTYATYWIKQEMQRYLEECGALVRIPSGLRGDMLKYKRLCRLAESCCNRKPTDKEAVQMLGITQARLEQIREALILENIKSLNTPTGNEEDTPELFETLAGDTDVEGEVLDRLEHEELKGLLWGMVARLPQQQSYVIKEHYQSQRTIKDISTETGETESQTKHREIKALQALRHCKGSTRLKSFIPECYDLVHGTGYARFNATWTSKTEDVALRMAMV
jgi:RNA polymerase primary sigma factor